MRYRSRISLRLRDLRLAFKRYFENLGYREFVHDSILPDKGSDLLFVNSGIVAIKHKIIEEKQGRYFSIQGCLRLSGKHNDLSEIGMSRRHHTYFEMAGHFVWGLDLNRVFNHALLFLKLCGLDKSELLITYHPDHIFGLKEVEIRRLEGYEIREDLENTWSSGNYGYQGYCLEIYLRRNARNNEEDLELWNCVFVDRYIGEDDKVRSLDRPFLDSGMGIARLAAVLDNHFDTYLNGDFSLPMLYLKSITLTESAERIVLDHIRSVLYIYHSGIRIGNKEEEYVLKKILRKVFTVIYLECELMEEHFLHLMSNLIRLYRFNGILNLNNSLNIKEDVLLDIERDFRRWYRSWKDQNAYLRSVKIPLNEREVARLIAERGFNRHLFKKHGSIADNFQWDLCERIIRNEF